MNDKIILDSSALLAFLQDEPGSEIIKPLLKNTIISSINLAEVLTILSKSSIEPSEALDYISTFIPTIIRYDELHAQKTAELYSKTKDKGLSLGDRACISLGIILNAPIFTSDKIWKELKLPKANIVLIR